MSAYSKPYTIFITLLYLLYFVMIMGAEM